MPSLPTGSPCASQWCHPVCWLKWDPIESFFCSRGGNLILLYPAALLTDTTGAKRQVNSRKAVCGHMSHAPYWGNLEQMEAQKGGLELQLIPNSEQRPANVQRNDRAKQSGFRLPRAAHCGRRDGGKPVGQLICRCLWSHRWAGGPPAFLRGHLSREFELLLSGAKRRAEVLLVPAAS